MDELLKKLSALGFNNVETPDTLVSDTEYPVTVHLDTASPLVSAIDYGPDVTVHHKGACNFSRPENLVVLECVLRLLKKGYPPGCLELEKERAWFRSGEIRVLDAAGHIESAIPFDETDRKL
jgi:hypothetical protein